MCRTVNIIKYVVLHVDCAMLVTNLSPPANSHQFTNQNCYASSILLCLGMHYVLYPTKLVHSNIIIGTSSQTRISNHNSYHKTVTGGFCSFTQNLNLV